jgi:citrate synthase
VKKKPWKSGITDVKEDSVRVCGYDIADLMKNAEFSEVVYLLYQSRLPSANEKRLFNALLIACADHGPKPPSIISARTVASGNPTAFEAAVAAGVLAIGDVHGGAGVHCMEMIASGLDSARTGSLSFRQAARLQVEQFVRDKKRLPGLGHRFHRKDPRAESIFAIAGEEGLDGDGIQYLLEIEAEADRQIRPMPVNVDGAIAAVLHDLDFPPMIAKAIFILGRVAGITAHVLEEVTEEKPMRFEPEVSYNGPGPRQIE